MIDTERLTYETGWQVIHLASTPSTNMEAARLRDTGHGPRVAVVADEQTRGRGRGGRDFSSPLGGLYVSLLLNVRPEDLPGPLTAALALSTAEAIEHVSGVACGIKWPNDLWVERKKLGGILLEAAGPALSVVAGIGLNLCGVPPSLGEADRRVTTALDIEAGRKVEREALLVALLARIDACTGDLSRAGRREALEAAWQSRLILVGETITYVHGGRLCRGRLLRADLGQGLLVDDEVDGRVRRRSAHVQDVRPA